MAGESPDKSEQRKSSGTAAEERDPRLAVFREPGALAGSGSDSTAGGVTDTATAVFRSPLAQDAPEASSDAPEDAGSDAGSDAGEPAGAGVQEADAGPEDVQDAPEADAGPEGAQDAPEGGLAPVEPGGRPGGSEGASAPREELAGADVAGGADAADEAAVPDEAAVAEARAESGQGSGQGSASVREPASESEKEPEPVSGSGTAGAPNDARLRAVVAAWVATPDVPDGDGEGTAGAEIVNETAGDSPERAESPRRPDDSVADVDDAADETADEAAQVGDSASDAPRVPKTREEPPAPAAEPADAKGSDAADSEEPAQDKRGIDQPTAIFKALRPARVDQPTTTLKLPPEPKPDSAQAQAQATAPKPETPAERTSKFVPLRSDDVRPAPAIGPTVTPEITPKPSFNASRTSQDGHTGHTGGPGPGYVEAERTRQQPLPPRPPLDLLAELTNTPPPRQTPVRTVFRRVKIWTPLLLLVVIIFAIAQAMRPLPEPVLELTAKPTYAFEGSKPTLPWPDEGQGFMAATGLGTVDSFGEQEAVPIGSVAKAMTAYVVLKGHPLKKGEDGPAVKIDAKAEAEGGLDSQGESTLNTVKAGDTLTEQEALAAIMIPSANNIARLLARWDAGSEEAFVKKMNDTAKELGMKNTTYTDPSGLNATTVSSAEDQVKLGQKLVEIPALMAITKLPSWTDPSGKSWRNYNTLVPYNGALGIKTGSTTKAGGNLLFAAHKMVGETDQLIVGAVLGQHKPPIIDTVNGVSKQVVLATQGLLQHRTIVKKGQVVGTVDDGFGTTTEVIVAEDVAAVGWSGLTVKLELTDDGKTMPNAAAAGTRVGTMTVGEGASQVKVAVLLGSELSEPTFGERLTRVG